VATAFATRLRDAFGFTSVAGASSAAFFVFVVFAAFAVLVVVRRRDVFLVSSVCSVSSGCSAVSLMAGWMGTAPEKAFPDGVEKLKMEMG
jgi:hypothetical protein